MSPSRRRRRASPEWAGRDVITVAALPGRGVYVRHLSHPEGVDGVHRPTVAPVGTQPSPRPPVFERRWLEANLDEYDVVHVHGVPVRATAQDVAASVAAVRAAGLPLVVTAYHLTDPHPESPLDARNGSERADYAAQLDALIPAADAVLTLTAEAAAEIERRWSVSASVVPHPHVVDFVRMRRERPRRPSGNLLIGAQLGGLRLPADPVAVVEALMSAAGQVEGTHVVVHVHENLLDQDSSRYAGPVIRAMERLITTGGGVLRAHRPLTDSQLWDNLFSLDASFVPPLAGSHSIWPEACYDLGTQALMPGDSLATGQQDVGSYALTSDGIPDVASLAAGIAKIKDAGDDHWRADPTARWNERVQICEVLRGLYETLETSRT